MIKRLLCGLMILALAITSGLAMNAPAHAQENPDCAGAEAYVRSVHTLQLVFNTTMGDLDAGEFQNWSSDDMEIGIQAATAMAEGHRGLTPPPAAEELSTALIDFYTVWADLLTAVQEAGMLGALSYLEDLNEGSLAMDTAGLAFEETCQIALMDNDGDGIPEIGAGNQPATPTSGEIDPNAPLGSFENPIPVGQPTDVGGGWSITVVAVRPDDTAAVLDENSFNEPPIEGRQFFVADVMVENTGTEPAEFDGNFRLRATGLEGDYRAFAPDDRCGVVANEWEEPTIAPGEQVTAAICWSVPTTDAGNIRLYDHEAITEARVYFALTPADGAATPAGDAATPAGDAATPAGDTGGQNGFVSRATDDDEETPVAGD